MSNKMSNLPSNNSGTTAAAANNSIANIANHIANSTSSTYNLTSNPYPTYTPATTLTSPLVQQPFLAQQPFSIRFNWEGKTKTLTLENGEDILKLVDVVAVLCKINNIPFKITDK